MKKTAILFIAAAALLSSCGGANFTVTGHYMLPPGDSVDLLNAEGAVIASGIVGTDTTVLLEGYVSDPGFAQIVSRNRMSRPVDFFLEPGDIRIGEYDSDIGYYAVTGTPFNDKKTAFEEEMKVFGEMVRKGVPGKTFDDILAECSALYRRTVDANPDNVFGVYVFQNYEFPEIKNDPEKVKARIARFTPEMQAHPMLKRSQAVAGAAERTAIGQPFTDLTLKNIDGEAVTLSSLTGPGRWVLLRFLGHVVQSLHGGDSPPEKDL